MSDEVKYVTLSLGMSDSGGDENLMKITEYSRLRLRESGHRYGTFCDNHLLWKAWNGHLQRQDHF